MKKKKEEPQPEFAPWSVLVEPRSYHITHLNHDLLILKYMPYAVINELYRFYALKYFLLQGYVVPDKILLMPDSPFYGHLSRFYLMGKIIKEIGIDTGKLAKMRTIKRSHQIITDLKERDLTSDELDSYQKLLSKYADREFLAEMYVAIMPILRIASDYFAQRLPNRLHGLMMRLVIESEEFAARKLAKEHGLEVPAWPKPEAFFGGEILSLKQEFKTTQPPKKSSKYDFTKIGDYYKRDHNTWKDVKSLYNSPELRKFKHEKRCKIVKAAYPNLPDDLIDRLGNEDAYQSSASHIAIEQAARRCGLPAERKKGSYPASYLFRLLPKKN